MRSINKLLITFSIIISPMMTWASPQLLKEVAQDLANAITKADKHPSILITNTTLPFATQVQLPNTIVVDKRVYDFCLQSSSVADAFATILVPVLIDFYGKSHQNEVAFAQIAGYDILQHANSLWAKVYRL